MAFSWYFQGIRRNGWTKYAAELLDNIYDCDYSANMTTKYLKHKAIVNQGSSNTRFWKVCNTLLPSNAACFQPEFINRACKLFPIKLVLTYVYYSLKYGFDRKSLRKDAPLTSWTLFSSGFFFQISTGQRLICTKVTSYETHNLVTALKALV